MSFNVEVIEAIDASAMELQYAEDTAFRPEI